MTDTAGVAARHAVAPAGLADGVYQRLRSAIVCGELRPNERLVEADLADWLEVSRTPVRECLQRLAAERLVANRRRGWIVLEHTIEDIREIYGVRAALEGYAAQLAAHQASPDQVERIMALARIDPATYADPPRRGFVEYNQQFHDTVVESCGNSRLAEAIRRSREYYFDYRIAAVYTPAEVAEAIGGHQAIGLAIQRRDPDAAERLARAHMHEALEAAVMKL
ncbi:MAG TPA: GntR family transcriptional regulator [Streptosporangiaceae bacterium]